jgi:hypothetical protein
VDRIYSTRLISDGKECQRLQNAKKFLVAATFEKSKTAFYMVAATKEFSSDFHPFRFFPVSYMLRGVNSGSKLDTPKRRWPACRFFHSFPSRTCRVLFLSTYWHLKVHSFEAQSKIQNALRDGEQ